MSGRRLWTVARHRQTIGDGNRGLKVPLSMSPQKIPYLGLTPSAPLIAVMSVVLTLAIEGPALGAYSPKDFDDCRRDGGTIVVCCRSAGGYLNEDKTKCMASYLFQGPSQGDGGALAPKAPTQTERPSQ
jgi:hypothetical protein